MSFFHILTEFISFSNIFCEKYASQRSQFSVSCLSFVTHMRQPGELYQEEYNLTQNFALTRDHWGHPRFQPLPSQSFPLLSLKLSVGLFSLLLMSYFSRFVFKLLILQRFTGKDYKISRSESLHLPNTKFHLTSNLLNLSQTFNPSRLLDFINLSLYLIFSDLAAITIKFFLYCFYSRQIFILANILDLMQGFIRLITLE